MKRIIAVTTMIMAIIVVGCNKEQPGQEVSGIEDLVLPESAFPEGLTWDPHPPDSTHTAICGISSNPFVSRDTAFTHCFCTRVMGMSPSLAATVTGAMTEILYHEGTGEIGLYNLEYESDSAAQAGYQHLTSRYSSTRYRFLLRRNFTIWVWVDSEEDTAYTRMIIDYYKDLFGG